jgi:hypothetical protein
MHRSGTSALCAALQSAGVSFGDGLLDPMQGVNDEGFWEDSAVVELNEALLEQAGLRWFDVPVGMAPIDWSSPDFDSHRERAASIIGAGFGGGDVQAVKDPRFCLTLSFWRQLAEQLGLAASACVISRSPLEVASSLYKRDGFPPGYGLRLDLAYRQQLTAQIRDDAFYISYQDLLTDPLQHLTPLLARLSLTADAEHLAMAVRSDLKHQSVSADAGNPLADHQWGDLAELQLAIEADYPHNNTQQQLLQNLVQRGHEMTRVGEAHSHALEVIEAKDESLRALDKTLRHAVATVEERDQQIIELDARLAEAGQHLAQALATLSERDNQIAELDTRLNETGRMHGEALAHIEATDAKLQRLFDKPGIGMLFKVMWSRESR